MSNPDTTRIFNYPEVTTPASDAKILLDSQTVGSKCIDANLFHCDLIDKTITQRGTFEASEDDADGFKKVVVDIPYTDVHVASGPIATFEGEDLPLKSLTASIVPVQDLHGYDHPWAGGGGKNKFGGEYNVKFTLDHYIPSGTTITISTGTASDSATRVNLYNASDSRFGNAGVNTVSGNRRYRTVTLTDDLYAILFDQYDNGNYQVEISSSMTSYAPYSNICPISGWDEANVSVSGFNIWNEEWINGYYNQGQFIFAQDAICCKNKIIVKPNTNMYYVKDFSVESNFYYTFYDINGNFLPLSGYDASGRIAKASSGVISVPSGAYYMTFNMGSAYGSTYNHDISLNYPSTDTSYHAYNGHTYTIPFTDSQGQSVEVFGGSVDVVNGGGNAYKEYPSYNGETLIGPWISDRDVYAPNTTPTIGAQVVDTGDTTTFYTQPTSIKSLDGVNNVFADSGDVDVEYQTVWVRPTE